VALLLLRVNPGQHDGEGLMALLLSSDNCDEEEQIGHSCTCPSSHVVVATPGNDPKDDHVAQVASVDMLPPSFLITLTGSSTTSHTTLPSRTTTRRPRHARPTSTQSRLLRDSL
jgi:hypothetical protein